jgi:hypothetical protein
MNNLKWRQINRGRTIADHPDGFFVVKPKVMDAIVPIACPICSLLMKTSDDSLAFRRFKCCDSCAARWAESRPDAWDEGWRPSKEEVAESVKIRARIVPKVRV